MEFPFSIIVNNEMETDKLAERFLTLLENSDVIVLTGNLGSGKTYFIRKIAELSGINYASSPSFAIVNEYEGRIKIYHFDFYRLNKIDELYNIGWQDYLNDTEAIIFIEWGELLKEALPVKRVEILITILGDTKRRFEFNKYG